MYGITAPVPRFNEPMAARIIGCYLWRKSGWGWA